jgi:hypothetical protein
VAPAGRVFTGIKRTDRESGNFEGVSTGQLLQALDELLKETESRRASS